MLNVWLVSICPDISAMSAMSYYPLTLYITHQ